MAENSNNFFGCGVVSYGTSVESMLRLKRYFKKIEKQVRDLANDS